MSADTRPAVTLHLCTTCRQGRRPGAPFARVTSLEAAARKCAQSLGIALQTERTSCLSGCHEGLTAMIETEAAMVRLRGIAGPAEIDKVFAHLDSLQAGAAAPEVAPLVLSTTRWADWD